MAAFAVAVAACANLAGIDSLEIGACKGGNCGPEGGAEQDRAGPEDLDGAAIDAPAGDTNEPCPGTAGPPGVRVGPTGNSFCIDATEVTNKQYKAFIAAKVDPSKQPPECGWNGSFDPSIGGDDDLPVVGIDWCDAAAFCKWSGKYLCGAAQGGKKTGPVTLEPLNDPKTNQWLLACSQEGLLAYPYGGIQKPQACNTGELDSGRSLPVGSLPDCNGGYPGIFDMVGNVWEWYDGPCRTDGGLEREGDDAGGPQTHECFVKGGAFTNTGLGINCSVNGLQARRDLREAYVGFRCCAD